MSILVENGNMIVNAKKEFDGIPSILHTLNSQVSYIHSAEQMHTLALTHNLTDLSLAAANASSHIIPIRNSIIAVDRLIEKNSAGFPGNVSTALSMVVKYVTYIEGGMNKLDAEYNSMALLIADLTTNKELFSTHIDTYSKAAALRASGLKTMNEMGDDFTKASTEYSKIMQIFLNMYEAEKAAAEVASHESVETLNTSSPNVIADLIDVAANTTIAQPQPDSPIIPQENTQNITVEATVENTVVYDAASAVTEVNETNGMESTIVVEQEVGN